MIHCREIAYFDLQRYRSITGAKDTRVGKWKMMPSAYVRGCSSISSVKLGTFVEETSTLLYRLLSSPSSTELRRASCCMSVVSVTWMDKVFIGMGTLTCRSRDFETATKWLETTVSSMDMPRPIRRMIKENAMPYCNRRSVNLMTLLSSGKGRPYDQLDHLHCTRTSTSDHLGAKEKTAYHI